MSRGERTSDPAPGWSVRLPVTLGLISLVILVGGFGAWSAMSQIAGAIIAPGRIEVEQNRQVTQHPDGGMVAEVAVREGQRVGAGEVLISLDGTELRSELTIVETQLFELLARQGRLEAERDEAAEVRFVPELMTLLPERDSVRDIVEGQRRLFHARRESMARQIEQMRQRQAQIASQIEGISAQRAALDIQLALIGQELEAQQDLLAKGLAQVGRVLALQREQARLQGQIGDLTARTAEARERSTEIDTEILRLETTGREEAITELRDVRFRAFELIERRQAIREKLARLEIRAPVGGIVYGLTVFGPGAVVRAAEPVLSIVPQDRPLVVSAQIDPIHIDSVFGGQPAVLRFSAFDARTTPEIMAHVVKVSADAFTDEATGRSYYRVELLPDAGEMDKLGDLQLIPGMPVEAFIRTADRSPLVYLVKPLTDYFNRAFREG